MALKPYVANLPKQRPEQNETSLALIPRDHPLIPPPRLEPEASGLLDRLLNIFHENPEYVHTPYRRLQYCILTQLP